MNKKQLTKKEYKSFLREKGFSNEEIKDIWMNIERRRK